MNEEMFFIAHFSIATLLKVDYHHFSTVNKERGLRKGWKDGIIIVLNV